MGREYQLPRQGGSILICVFNEIEFRNAAGSVQRSGEKGAERTLGAECAEIAVQRFAPEPRDSLEFLSRACWRRPFTWLGLAERMSAIPRFADGRLSHKTAVYLLITLHIFLWTTVDVRHNPPQLLGYMVG